MDKLLNMSDEKTFPQKCKDLLEKQWKSISKEIESDKFSDPISSDEPKLKSLIFDCLTSKIKTYHYVLPTQVLAKCINSKLDCHSIQTAFNKPGAFDARTIAHDVIVPFDQANHKVLGGSTEPYVNNPLRCPAVIKKYQNQQKNKEDWNKLIRVLDAIEEKNDPSFTIKILDQILVEIYRLLSDVQVVYPTPNRVSLKQTLRLVSSFSADKSGGDRVEAICTALFRAIAKQFGLFDDVRRQKVNAADASSGMSADIECRLKDKIVFLVEVKDRSLTLTQIDAKLDVARARKISEILFLAEQGLDKEDKEKAEERILSEFTSGQNIYVSNFIAFSAGILILLGEKGRVFFLSLVGDELDGANSSIVHRKAWANLLKSI
jgi:SacI restriction endonuclease